MNERFNPYDLNHVAMLNYGTPEEFAKKFRRRIQPRPVVDASNRGLLKLTEEEMSPPKPQEPQV